ncbi:MAG: hypothetical protein IJU08_06135 [Bacteroidales bacterium]|nr:hypothetical protein [Bacteroidales bacterium]MBQ9398057.1 hypothetical protein [Bacteroidales bacterium]
MKATKYIAALALLLGVMSCQPEMFNENGDPSDAETAELVFSVQFPEPIPVTTKGTMDDGPRAAEAFDIHLCLYGPGEGYVQNWLTATKVGDPSTRTFNGIEYITGGNFKVLLPLTDEKRTVHIIANPPESATPTTSDYIDNVMEKLINEGNTCSYWQEIILPSGIYADPNDGTKVHQDIKTAFTDVQLLRNFAKVIVDGPEEGEDLFELESWTLINVPKKGYVAPYTGIHTDEGRFPTGYRNAYLAESHTVTERYNQLLVTDAYKGSMPPVKDTMINVKYPGNPESADQGVYVGNGRAKYMYERPLPTAEQAQTAVLIKVTFKEGHKVYELGPNENGNYSYWYKVELLDDKGAYVPILRDFVYKLHILGLDEPGYLSAREAFNGAYFGNISASLETASLSELSNGKSTIYAKTLDYTIMVNPGGTGASIPLENSDFYFIPDLTNLPGERFWKTSSGKCTFTNTVERVQGYPRALDSIANVEFTGNSDGTGPGTITITPNAIDETMKKSIIRIKAKGSFDGSKELYRDIMITLMQKPDFARGEDTTCISNAGTVQVNGIGNEVVLKIWLPEGLGSSVFPVQVRIEAEKNTLTAQTPDLPVKTGKSLFDSSRNTFYFIYTINYSDYCWLNPRTRKYENKYDFTCSLFTSTSGDNSTQIMINDMRGIQANGTVNPDKENFNSMTLTLQAPPTNP